uniref:Uncharacterized protein n=1 Tax=Pichia etchellsii TaxID=28550 RepID=Q9C126_PICET|nr:hypothetical protein [Schwanniomyces etchellsii]
MKVLIYRLNKNRFDEFYSTITEYDMEIDIVDVSNKFDIMKDLAERDLYDYYNDYIILTKNLKIRIQNIYFPIDDHFIINNEDIDNISLISLSKLTDEPTIMDHMNIIGNHCECEI